MTLATGDLAAALSAQAEALQQRLLAKVEANLSGAVLQTRSGALKASVSAELTSNADGVTAAVFATGVPYAAIQEYGGTTPAHIIVPVKARALAFAGGFSARVQHPGSQIPARAPFGAALDALRDEIAGSLKDAVRVALGA